MYENNDEIMAAIARNVVSEFEHVCSSSSARPMWASWRHTSSERALWANGPAGAMERCIGWGWRIRTCWHPGALPNRPSQGPGRHRAVATAWSSLDRPRSRPGQVPAADRSLKPDGGADESAHGIQPAPPRRLCPLDEQAATRTSIPGARLISIASRRNSRATCSRRWSTTTASTPSPRGWATAWGCWRAACALPKSVVHRSGAPIAWRRSTPCCRAAASMPPDELRSALEKLVSEYALEWQWDRAHQIADEFHAAGHITAVD